jgi:hypothetical protein
LEVTFIPVMFRNLDMEALERYVEGGWREEGKEGKEEGREEERGGRRERRGFMPSPMVPPIYFWM